MTGAMNATACITKRESDWCCATPHEDFQPPSRARTEWVTGRLDRSGATFPLLPLRGGPLGPRLRKWRSPTETGSCPICGASKGYRRRDAAVHRFRRHRVGGPDLCCVCCEAGNYRAGALAPHRLVTGRLDRNGAIFPLSATARSGHGSANGLADKDQIAAPLRSLLVGRGS